MKITRAVELRSTNFLVFWKAATIPLNLTLSRRADLRLMLRGCPPRQENKGPEADIYRVPSYTYHVSLKVADTARKTFLKISPNCCFLNHQFVQKRFAGLRDTYHE